MGYPVRAFKLMELPFQVPRVPLFQMVWIIGVEVAVGVFVTVLVRVKVGVEVNVDVDV